MSARILVVDDIESNRKLLKATLEAHYYDVALAKDGFEALTIVTDVRPEIILLDVMMPGLDGFEVCRRLKGNPETRHIPVIMLTALNDPENRVRGLKAGADDFLSKPFKDFALLARLEALARYNAVAKELRDRDSRDGQFSAITREESEELARPGFALVVDSDERLANKTANSIRRSGHTAITWQESKNLDPKTIKCVDIIVLALSGQKHNALKLCATLKHANARKELSILVSCDRQDIDKAAEAFKIGAADMVLNPLDDAELNARIKTQLRRTRYLEMLRRRVDQGVALSVIDQLTGLYNRRYLQSQLDAWMRRSRKTPSPLSVIALDIDHFKQVNDTYGHEAGDEVLKEFSERLLQHVRPKDIVCRPGGEEFLVILPETEGDRACVGAERIRQAIAGEPFHLTRADKIVDITVSAGVACFDQNDARATDLLHRADQALYQAKRGGRNRIESVAA